MRRVSTLLLFLQLAGCASTRPQPPQDLASLDPSQLYGELFERVQRGGIFADSKSFVDLVPRDRPEAILKAYQAEKPATKEALAAFVAAHFYPLEAPTSSGRVAAGPIRDHIRHLWKALTRPPDREVPDASSLIPLPFSYVVPGGRFREIYYWDSYFTQLGLLADGEDALFQNMVLNFDHLIQALGRVPNGNRDYYRGRSQPPFFSWMVELWRKRFGDASALRFLPSLRREHEFWMSGNRVVELDGGRLNRYWDDRAEPRPEAYRQDVALAEEAARRLRRQPSDVYRELRAAAESGWDFSTRWFARPDDFASIETTAYVPVDLNSLLYHLEQEISELSRAAGDTNSAGEFADQAARRRALIERYLWDESSGTWRDYHWKNRRLSAEPTVAMVVPLFVGLASPEQARRTAHALEHDFLKAGGLVTTLRLSGQQWDAPNGWAPHQWMGYAGLRRYGFHRLANQIKNRWLRLNRKVYQSTGKLMEKYNVIQTDLKSGGGEYPNQDGFGWTNGVYEALSEP